MYKLAILSVLFAGTFAINGSLRKVLAEKANKNLVEVDADQSDCGCCSLPAISKPSLSFCPDDGTGGVLPPNTGSASTNAYSSTITA